MFKWPTSELPIRPSGRPTAREEASSSVYPVALLAKSSMTGVLALVMASPSLGESAEGTPQPSMTTVWAKDHQNQPGQLEVDKYETEYEEIIRPGSIGAFAGFRSGSGTCT